MIALRYTSSCAFASMNVPACGESSRTVSNWLTGPRARSTGQDDESGRGLHLVHAYADDWGWFRINGGNGSGSGGSGTGSGSGKYVWCELGTEPRRR
ncbi:hypothetical protein [Streptomyces sp. V3I8]|uniref:hypothetical protein n=1 Tax=Streptomyces sp. V3I8 TaxID=3042279 RepID=UPI0027D79249|nr:hypothetical protein [Streptomyces sp. V3I8]